MTTRRSHQSRHDASINRMRFAGSWYPSDPRSVTELLESEPTVGVRTSGAPTVAAVLPHAGLRFSARGQAAFWHGANVDGRRLVLILSPSHYVGIPRAATLGALFDAHETPLGILPGLTASLGDDRHDAAHAAEHGIELLLPAVRHSCDPAPLVASLLVGQLRSPREAREAARRILDRLFETAPNLSPRNDLLILASSDFTHYGPRFRYTPFGPLCDEVAERIRAHDLAIAELAADAALESYLARISADDTTICGRDAIALMLALAEQLELPIAGRTLDYYTSRDLSGAQSDDSLVAYAPIGYTIEAGS